MIFFLIQAPNHQKAFRRIQLIDCIF